MPDNSKPISASNPPESRGERRPKDETPLTTEDGDFQGQAVYQPTAVEPSPAMGSSETVGETQPVSPTSMPKNGTKTTSKTKK
jgi:hypothetical protein